MVNQVQNPPSAAYWLSLIGGILALIGAVILLAFGVVAMIAFGQATNYYDDYSGYYTGDVSGAFGLAWGLLLGLGVWMMISSIIVIISARKLKADPMAHGKWGALILVFSLIGSWSILNFIGGILAIVYKPIPAGAAPQYAPQQPYYGPPPAQAYQAPPQAHTCPQCGTMVQPGVKFCPNCGRQQY